MADAYFGQLSVDRQRLLWTGATRLQLHRWEPLVAENMRRGWGPKGEQLTGAEVWQASIEHHFALIAARNLIHALELDPTDPIPVDPVLRAELIEGRDVHEHWVDNMPVFNRRPRAAEPPRRSGKDFAARNPDSSPYWWLGWTQSHGPHLLPNVPAHALRDLLDDVESRIVARRPDLRSYLPPRLPSAWQKYGDEWWPAPERDDRPESP